MNRKKVIMKITRLNKMDKKMIIMKIWIMMIINMTMVRMMNTKAMIFLMDNKVSEN
jgi:hypothetical protein